MPTHPAFDADRWYAAVPTRRSRRAYDGTPPTPGELAALSLTAATFLPFDDARVVLIEQAPSSLFTGIIGSYGRVSNARSALVFVADGSSWTADEHCGYTGEGLVLEAHALGLVTCWIGGSFSRAVSRGLVDLCEGEVVRAVSPVGRPAAHLSGAERLLYGQARPKHRKPLDQIAPGSASWPAWAVEGVRAAQVAPSAMNRQPWRFRFEGGSVVVSSSGAAPGLGRLDCGIAMLHFELGARSGGADGAWEPLRAPDIARWVPLA
jgi:nitroreductase